jgi:hypothetical protein
MSYYFFFSYARADNNSGAGDNVGLIKQFYLDLRSKTLCKTKEKILQIAKVQHKIGGPERRTRPDISAVSNQSVTSSNTDSRD